MKRSIHLLSFAAAMPLILSVSFAQGGPPPGARGQRGAPGGPGGPVRATPKPYSQVVTKDAVTQTGLFKVHRIDEKVLFEIPKSALGKDLLWKATTTAGNSSDAFAGQGAGQTVVRFVRRGNQMYLKQVDYGLRDGSEGDGGFKANVTQNSEETIVNAFPVLAISPDGDAVIDVSALFLSNPSQIGSRRPGNQGAVDASRSFIEKVKDFPTNVEVASTETISPAPGGAGGFLGPRSTGTTTTRVHYSMVALPEKPMMGRLADDRIGFFHTDFSSIGGTDNRVETKGFITRYRLEKKDPSAALSEPVKPITWYVSHEVPAKWRPYVKQGIEDWNVAFQQAGFKNAVVALDAPDDPDWSEGDARYSVVHWSPRAVENAYAGPTTDPRSGETISSQMVIFQDVMKLAQGWYFVQCGAVDPRAANLPDSDALMGRLIRYVVSHECGHALGLYHNWKASSHYTIAQLRNPKFTSENGVSCSIMDYSRFNYVAQPGDGVTQLIGKIGVYDKFAITWGYKPIAGVSAPEDERHMLDTWLGRQVADPRLRYWPEGDPIDPAAQNEDIGDDAVLAGRLGMKNLDRISQNLLLKATSKYGKNYDLLAEMHNFLMSQRMQETIHVLKNVGGVEGNDYHAGRGGDVYTAVPRAKQAECVAFLMNEAITPSAALYAPSVLNKIQPAGLVNQISNMQAMVLRSLLDEARLERLTDFEAMQGGKAYRVQDLIGDITVDAWSELSNPHPTIGLVRRSLQRNYLRTFDAKVNTPAPSQTDVKMYSINALKILAARLDNAIPRTVDPTTRLHMQTCRRDVGLILENKFSPVTMAAAPAPIVPGRRAIDCFDLPLTAAELAGKD